MKLDSSYFLSAQQARWIIVFLISLFSLLTLWEVSRLFWSIDSEIPASSTKELAKPVTDNSLDELARSSLFGVYISNDLTSDNVRKSMLNITLVGILLGNTPEDSQVIIQMSNGEEKNYKIDEQIPGGALIKKIMAGGILVEHNGALESVTLPKSELIFEPVAKPLRND